MRAFLVFVVAIVAVAASRGQTMAIPEEPLVLGAFSLHLRPDGAFADR